jgi:maltooligosyltrehalose trehalohydrolase
MPVTRQRRLSAGLEIQDDGSVQARVWAPECSSVAIVLDADRSRRWQLAPESDGYFEGDLVGLHAGDRYWLRLDGDRLRPDPVSRYPPDGPPGSSMLVDPAAFTWTDQHWQGITGVGQAIYSSCRSSPA